MQSPLSTPVSIANRENAVQNGYSLNCKRQSMKRKIRAWLLQLENKVWTRASLGSIRTATLHLRSGLSVDKLLNEHSLMLELFLQTGQPRITISHISLQTLDLLAEVFDFRWMVL